MVVLAPLILVHIREYVKKDDYRKGIWCLLFLCSVCAILYVFCSIKGIPLELSIYGNRDFSSVKDIVDNISVFLKACLECSTARLLKENCGSRLFAEVYKMCFFMYGYRVYRVVYCKV